MALGAPLALSALFATAAGPPAASAASIPIRVDFDAPTGCSSAGAFYDGVAARSDRMRRASPGEASVRFGVRVWRSGARVHGELRLIDGQSAFDTRRVDGSACDEVVGVLSLTAALAIDPAARLGPPAGAPQPPSSGDVAASGGSDPGGARAPSGAALPAATPSPPLPPPAPPPNGPAPEQAQPAIRQAAGPPADDRAPSGGPPIQLGVGVQGIVARVLAPTVAMGGGLSLRLLRERADAPPRSAELSALYLTNDPWGSADEVVARWAALALTVCPGWGLSGAPLAIDLCAQAVGGWLQVTDRAVTSPASVSRFWGTMGGMARFGIPVGRGFSVEAEVAFGIALMERRFITTTPEETVGDTPPVAIASAIGFARRF